jgi:prevent-host-death family protein
VPGDAAAQFNIHDAKTHLSQIIERVERGEEIIISRAGHPVAKVIPLAGSVRRRGRGSHEPAAGHARRIVVAS